MRFLGIHNEGGGAGKFDNRLKVREMIDLQTWRPSVNEQGIREIIKRENLLRATTKKKLWSAMITNVLKKEKISIAFPLFKNNLYLH